MVKNSGTGNPAKRLSKKKDLLQLLLAILIIILINIIGSFVFYRFDLTSVKRYTLSETTKNMIKKLDDVVYFKIYLEGEFPAGFKRLRNSTKEVLDEFRAYSDNIEYQFINPSENPDQKQRNLVYKQLHEKGLQPTALEVRQEEGSSQQIIFPGAIVSYKGQEVPLQLLKTQMGVSSDEQLNNSVQGLEYELSNAIRKLSMHIKPRIAFIEGQGELDSLSVADIMNELGQYYEVNRVSIHARLKSLDDYRAIVIAKPDSAFDEKDKFIIDQFIMRGGKALWLLDPLYTSMDSLKRSGQTMAMAQELNLEDQLFKYGVRLNLNLVMDAQSSRIPVNRAFAGSPPRWQLVPWFFNPLIIPVSRHPIVKNLDLIKLEFASTLDTIGNNIKKTILLSTSKYTRLVNAPARVHLGMVNLKFQYKQSYQPVAVLLEGEFESVFKNRLPPEITESKEIAFMEKSKATKMIVVSDGDVIKNEVQLSSGKAYALGYDTYTRYTYGNKNFILNCINYLCDDSGLLAVRAREVKLRMLDKNRIKQERLKWQLVNTLLPVLVLIGFGMTQAYVRKRKYGK